MSKGLKRGLFLVLFSKKENRRGIFKKANINKLGHYIPDMEVPKNISETVKETYNYYKGGKIHRANCKIKRFRIYILAFS